MNQPAVLEEELDVGPGLSVGSGETSACGAVLAWGRASAVCVAASLTLVTFVWLPEMQGCSSPACV